MKDATTNTITPRDEQEAKTLSVGARIATVIGIVGTAVSALLAAFGGLDWITSPCDSIAQPTPDQTAATVHA
jgi:hypothetical protein